MAKDCCEVCDDDRVARDQSVRRILWTVLAVNAGMFVTEVSAGVAAGSLALQADSLDFLGDAATYGISLFVLSRSLAWRAGAALAKGGAMFAIGLIILVSAGVSFASDTPPAHATMGIVGALALAANVACAALLYRFRAAESNLRSAWLCSRNDAIGNVAVLAAAFGVWGTATQWPDLVVGVGMASLAMLSSVQVIRQALGERANARRALPIVTLR
jgi:Co/Zn/Cd efflux system component